MEMWKWATLLMALVTMEASGEPCPPGLCGDGAECDMRGAKAFCRCPDGYLGNPLVRCRAECETDSDCSHDEFCNNHRCRKVCSADACAPGATCDAVGHRPVCTCPPGYRGSPEVRCYAECEDSSHCPSSRACVNNKCVDPCLGVCGQNAECEVRNHAPVCKCPRGYLGSPLTRCHAECEDSSHCPSTRACINAKCVDPCLNACGQNAECEVRNHSPVCKCPPGYLGSPLTRCHAECEDSTHCPSSRACINAKCVDPCVGACGQNAECEVRNHAPVCKCPPGYLGSPLTRCRAECEDSTHCPSSRACINAKCVDPCVGACGQNAECEVRNHAAVCKCPPGYLGSPLTRCRAECEDSSHCPSSRACINAKCVDPCVGACGQNAECEVRNHAPVCKCPPGYLGSPLTRCHAECEDSTHCPSSRACVNAKCVNPCVGACGQNAECEVRNHAPVCKCPPGFLGSPLSRCYAECEDSTHCPSTKACINAKCADPCVGVCGQNAECEVVNHSPICKCPKGTTGHPFHQCKTITEGDVCRESRCGVNADCSATRNSQGYLQATCTCPRGYFGNPLNECRRGECEDDNDCRSNMICQKFHCTNPCYESACGIDANCEVRNHRVYCSCPMGFTGNALIRCHPN